MSLPGAGPLRGDSSKCTLTSILRLLQGRGTQQDGDAEGTPGERHAVAQLGDEGTTTHN